MIRAIFGVKRLKNFSRCLLFSGRDSGLLIENEPIYFLDRVKDGKTVQKPAYKLHCIIAPDAKFETKKNP
jgi:hypothetical protein